jgi:hypothetical protein
LLELTILRIGPDVVVAGAVEAAPVFVSIE